MPRLVVRCLMDRQTQHEQEQEQTDSLWKCRGREVKSTEFN